MPSNFARGLMQAAAYHDANVKSFERSLEDLDPKDLDARAQASISAANHFDFANDMRRMAGGVPPLNCPQWFVDALPKATTPEQTSEAWRQLDADLEMHHRTWSIDGDLYRCRHCERGHLASKATEKFVHAADCPVKGTASDYPWLVLGALTGRLPAQGSVEQISHCPVCRLETGEMRPCDVCTRMLQPGEVRQSLQRSRSEALTGGEDPQCLNQLPVTQQQISPDLAQVYDVIGLHHSQPVSVLVQTFKSCKRFADYLHAVEQAFFMVPGEPSEEPEDIGLEPDDECLVSKWPAASAEDYVGQFGSALEAIGVRQQGVLNARDAEIEQLRSALLAEREASKRNQIKLNVAIGHIESCREKLAGITEPGHIEAMDGFIRENKA